MHIKHISIKDTKGIIFEYMVWFGEGLRYEVVYYKSFTFNSIRYDKCYNTKCEYKLQKYHPPYSMEIRLIR